MPKPKDQPQDSTPLATPQALRVAGPEVTAILFFARAGLRMQVRWGSVLVWEKVFGYFDVGAPNTLFFGDTITRMLNELADVCVKTVKEKTGFDIVGHREDVNNLPPGDGGEEDAAYWDRDKEGLVERTAEGHAASKQPLKKKGDV